ncbi:MAG: phosphatase PAP2 family protein [Dehalococcoidia bacterium]
MDKRRIETYPLPLLAGRVLREVALVATGLLVYFLVRGNVAERATHATRNAIAVIDAEKALGIFWEPAMQRWILDSAHQINFWNWIYFWAHAPAIVAVGIWLLCWHHKTYRLIRNAFLVSAVFALICYYLYPVAPPRLVSGYGFVDTMLLYSNTSYQAQSLKLFVNPYAAMPSLHFGWAFLLGVGIYLVMRDARGIILGTLITVSMGFAVVLTGNHYILDAVAGFVVALIGLAVAIWWDRGHPMWPRREARATRPSRAPSAA